MDHEPPKHRPPNTSFKQQRLKAWQPILTAKSVLPTFFIMGILFAPLGGLLVWRNNKVTEFSFDYTDCITATLPGTTVPDSNFVHSSPVGAFANPTYSIAPSKVSVTVAAQAGGDSWMYPVNRCTVNFTLPVDLQPPVMLYYKLTNFYQNHRKYTKSLDYKQLAGEAAQISEIRGRKGCPLESGELIYPCGLIANSLFNDTFYPVRSVATDTAPPGDGYTFQETGIAWASDKDKYGKYGYTNLSSIYIPENWRPRYPGPPSNPTYAYSADFPPPNIETDEHFQVWMRTAGWPTFLKPYGRNDQTVFKAGQYQMDIDMNFPITTYGGRKHVVITTLGATGGRNNFLGIGFIVAAILSAGLGIIFTAFHIAKPRIIGDHSKISFGGEATSHTRSPNRDDAGGNRIRSRYEDD
ncbi:hypothetical protein CPC16_010198 [Podila verticillata]|nr:hypothetical protein CPC16_010198 [Podila verticillata]